MRPVVIDFESFYSQDYTLSKLSTEEYIRDPRFEALGAAIKWSPEHAARWYDARRLKQVLKDEDWSDVFLIAHHAQFDGFISSHHYQVFPKMWGCTLSMARMAIGTHVSASLDSVRSFFGIPAKRTPYHLFRGKHWHELTADEQEQVAEGCCDEVESIWKIFCEMAPSFPAEEYDVIDATIRMFTEPYLRADVDLLGKLWEGEAAAKQQRGAALRVSESDLQSSDKFKALLEAEGIEIEYKKGKNDLIPAFAKTDEFMRELLEHTNDRIRGLAEARLGVKSTLLQTRAATLGWMASRGSLPVYLRYCGAHTTRWSGGDDINWQNFKRDSDLRRAILAPEGYYLGVIDLSQIECRLLNYLAGQEDVVEKFRLGQDPYIGIATQFYGRRITTADKNERGTGKQAELSCGFGCGADKFQATAKLGIYGPPVSLAEADAKRFVDLYRKTHPAVTQYWRTATRIITRLAGGPPMDWGPMRIEDGKIYLPNGAWLDYTTLEHYEDGDTGDRYWRIKKRHGWTKIYGGKLVENVVQALARVVVSQAMLRIRRLGLRILGTNHDELLILIPNDGRQQEYMEACRQEMVRVPDWLPGMPLEAEMSIGERYSK